MPRTKSLATLIQYYGSERVFKPKANKIPAIYKILNREIFNNRLKTPHVKIRRIRGALGLFEFNPYATKHCYRITLHNKFKNFQEFVEILGHEMVHYYQKLVLKQNSAKHNKEFYSFRKRFSKMGLELKRIYR